MDLVKLSARIKIAISGLGEIEKAMNRPFMFNGVRYDSDHMFFQMKRLRIKLIRSIPKLAGSQEMFMFYTIEGTISDVRKLKKTDYEFADGDSEAESSESDYSELDEDELNNRTLNEKSEFGGRSVDRAKRTLWTEIDERLKQKYAKNRVKKQKIDRRDTSLVIKLLSLKW